MADKNEVYEAALALHASGRPGKYEIRPTKPLSTARDLSLAYTPGVAAPCLAIKDDPERIYELTNKGDLVAVISNGTAVLGLGNIGAKAAKPVMEGKAVLFKRFSDIDGVDICVDAPDPDTFVNSVRYLGPSFGGINLEDIRGPECFEIEERLQALMDIPVFHDDQHGTAVVVGAALLNALFLTGRDIASTKLVSTGGGAAGIACLDFLVSLGLRRENVRLFDIDGLIRPDRPGLHPRKAVYGQADGPETLAEAIVGADVFLGLSAPGLLKPEMVAAMADKPIIFALANPTPEILPDLAREARPDAIIATGRSDFPNQVNNVLGFPFIFRGALDVRARQINEEMKRAASRALAELAREDAPEEVRLLHPDRPVAFGAHRLIPSPFDPRLIERVAPAVALAATRTGVARRPLEDAEAYKAALRARMNRVRAAD